MRMRRKVTSMRPEDRSLPPYTSLALRVCPGLSAGASQRITDLDEDLRKLPRQLTATRSGRPSQPLAREAYVDLRLTVEHLLASLGVLESLLLARIADVYAIHCVMAGARRWSARAHAKRRVTVPIVNTVQDLPKLAGEARNALRDFRVSRRALHTLTTHSTRQSIEGEWRALLSAATTLARLQLLCLSILDVLLRDVFFRVHQGNS
jgi:hypothetical protein